MRVIYKGKFREDLNDYINDQPWMFELDGAGMSFWELPICMQWGVVQDFADSIDFEINTIWGINMMSNLKFGYDWEIINRRPMEFESIKEWERNENRDSARKTCIEQFQKWYNENN